MSYPQNRPPFKPKNAIKNNVNHQIRGTHVRIVDIPKGYEDEFYEKDNVYEIDKALIIAKKLGMDLIQISSDNTLPLICKIIEISKFKYDQKQKDRQNKSKSAEIKEIRLSQNIGDNDLNVKAKKATEFLRDGDKVKVTMEFKGRGNLFKDQGELVMVKFADAVKEFGIPESMPETIKKMMHYMLKPIKSNKK